MALEQTLLVGLQASYDALTPDDTKLYFCSDTRNMYKGADLYTDGIRAVTTDPTTPAVGVIYYNTTDDVMKFYDGSSWTTVRLAYTTTLTSASTDEQIPTAAAVYDYVTAAIADVTGSGAVVQSVTAGTADATLSVTTGGAASTVTIPGVITDITYDSTTRKFTWTESDGTSASAELGKDIFLDPDANNAYSADDNSIHLFLNDGTEITIPASSLIDVYTGGTTTTATVAVSDANVITATVTLSSDANNALVVDATNGGLLVDLSDYATTSYVDSAIADVESEISTLSTQVSTNTAAIATLNGDNTTEGSVKYQIAQAQATLTSAIEAAQSTADDAASAASDAQDAADAAQSTADSATTAAATAQSTADTNTTNITEITNALTWGSF